MERITKPVEGQPDGHDTAAFIFWIGLEALAGSKAAVSQVSIEQESHITLIRN